MSNCSAVMNVLIAFLFVSILRNITHIKTTQTRKGDILIVVANYIYCTVSVVV